MVETEVVLINTKAYDCCKKKGRNRLRGGFHAYPSCAVATVADRFKSTIQISFRGKKADAKSLMALMMLGAPQRSVLKVMCEGDDEKEAIAAIVSAINQGFGEEICRDFLRFKREHESEHGEVSEASLHAAYANYLRENSGCRFNADIHARF